MTAGRYDADLLCIGAAVAVVLGGDREALFEGNPYRPAPPMSAEALKEESKEAFAEVKAALQYFNPRRR